MAGEDIPSLLARLKLAPMDAPTEDQQQIALSAGPAWIEHGDVDPRVRRQIQRGIRRFGHSGT